jgi:hypothetical protein
MGQKGLSLKGEGFVLDDPRDIKALAQSIISLSQSGVLKGASRAGCRLAQRNSHEHCSEEMLKVFQKIGGWHVGLE